MVEAGAPMPMQRVAISERVSALKVDTQHLHATSGELE